MTAPRPRIVSDEPSPPLTPHAVSDAPELAALVLLTHAIDVARVAVLAQYIDLLDPDAPFRRDRRHGDALVPQLLASARALSVLIYRYRAAVTLGPLGFTPPPAASPHEEDF